MVCGGRSPVSPAAALADFRTAGVEPDEPFIFKNTWTPCPGTCVACGERVSPQLNNIRAGQGACRKCADSRRANEQRLPQETAVAEFRSAGVEPDEPFVFQGVWLPCPGICMTCGGRVAPRLGNIRSGQGGCRRCATDRQADRRRVPHHVALAEFRAAGMEPEKPFVYVNAITPCRSTCMKCGSKGDPRLSTIRLGHGGCRSCGGFGFNPARRGWVYIVETDDGVTRKFGISNVPKIRVAQHRRQGFPVVVEIVGFDDGAIALRIEQDMKTYLRSSGVSPASEKTNMPYSGWTETYATSAAPHLTIGMFGPDRPQVLFDVA